MLHAGHTVRLFSYGPVPDAPKGVILEDARDVLPENLLSLVDRGVWTVGQLSDFFRVMLMRDGRGIWLDTDIYLLKPFIPDPAKPFLAWEDGHRLGVSALYFPRDCPVIGEFERHLEDFLAGRALLPNWLGFRRRVLRPLWFRALGKELTPSQAGITIYANDGITRLAQRHSFIDQAAPKETFYYWNGKACLRLYDPAFGRELLDHPGVIGIHFARKSSALVDAKPASGSFYDWAVSRLETSAI
ncbi:hypothetical protein IZ6_14740 [Terrihabitans soli]|uniref:Alpha 1,4-glycosyltransferase domain-containing protein n=2 Tax=Terrihabitans soli TaxID=708113 RepID=A0A6S6QP41_9HYPH|nr:hypothetical protein IZ6_14740 [Terrihabitans soli]